MIVGVVRILRTVERGTDWGWGCLIKVGHSFFMKIVAALLVLSVALNVYLLTRPSRSSESPAAAPNVEMGGVATESQVNKHEGRVVGEAAGASDARELARLRNEVGQLRAQAREAEAARMRETAQWRARVDAATQSLARAESALSEAAKLSPEQMQQMKVEANSVRCVSNLKQIGLAARMWAHENGNVLPPDFMAMKAQLTTPRILFCVEDPAAIQVSDWTEVNPALISYRFLNPNGSLNEPQKPMAICATHRHVVLSDGSVHRAR